MENKEFLGDLKRGKEEEYFRRKDYELIEAMRSKKDDGMKEGEEIAVSAEKEAEAQKPMADRLAGGSASQQRTKPRIERSTAVIAAVCAILMLIVLWFLLA